MPYITTDQIRDMSVKTVEMFLNDKVPLSVGLAKQASALQLNSEQIHRAVEATNSIAHLKVMSLSQDRTVEFDLCKYAEVVADIATPNIEKVAKVTAVTSPAVSSEASLEKQAGHDATLDLSQQEKMILFTKMASINARELEELKIQAEILDGEIVKQASLVSKQPRALEKVASVASGDEFKTLSKAVFGKELEHADIGIFKAAELVQAEKLQSMVKQASELRAQIEYKQGLHDQCELVKQAFLGGILKGIGSAIGSTVGGAVKTVASAPFKVVGNAAARTMNNVSQSAGNAAKSFVNPIRKAMGKSELPLNTSPAKKFGLGAAALAAGGIATDAAMYNPGTDATTGRSKDIWTSLQREPN